MEESDNSPCIDDRLGDRLYEVAVDAPIFSTLTYAAPIGIAEELLVGAIVLAPLGNRQITGYVLGEASTQRADAQATYQVRPLVDILSLEPFFPATLVPFYRWIAQYYHYPIGEVIRTALPLAPGARSGRRIVLTDKGKAHCAAQGLALMQQMPWLSRLVDKGELSPAAVRKIWRNPQKQRAVLALEQKGFVDILPELLSSGGRTRTEAVVRIGAQLVPLLAQQGNFCSDELNRYLEAENYPPLRKSEHKLLEIFFTIAEKTNLEVARSSLRQAYPNHGPALKRLLARDFLGLSHNPVFRDPFAGLQRQPVTTHQLTEAQKDVLGPLVGEICRNIFAPFLLFGVTGSGKTEVYLLAVATALAQGKSALLLVPEIALAAQLETELRARFDDQVAVLHSGMSDGERIGQWQRVLWGKARIVLGARSAIFAPLSNLGVIVVDEEHESSYKQEDGLPYHARDLAVLRAKQEKCLVLLGSATPALTSYHHAITGKYQLLQLPERVSAHPLPQVQLVDMRAEEMPREHQLFSRALLSAMRENLEFGRQTLLFLNRRGFATFMQCRDCGFVLECKHCRVSLTWHRSRNQLLCHYCGYHQRPDTLCPACGSGQVMGRGLGTERIEEEIAVLFPLARIARVDSDSSRNRRQLLEVLKAMQEREIDILVGTQMIAKGLHFPHVTLVGVLWADAGLNLPDFRAGERTFAQIAQVTGRAGRGESPGRVIVQTYQPEHYAVRLAQNHNYVGLYNEEIALRQPLGYPPFTRLVNVRISGLNEGEVEQAATDTAAFLRQQDTGNKVAVLGPVPAPLAKIKNRVRWQILLKSAEIIALHRLCDQLNSQKKTLCPRSVAVQMDVDPENML